ncbi:hypothetical protein KAFR_0C06480 [Kazachstania africana CBS 2517]|uniref:1,3-beta-glucanosyltransferase n=1 Tax=Kazachstania africana (strain ATCC 22294 / BCRC 22015 / CBS 2517 / CECT 1963 / NBRC 1671 / NRRL Y-8276) TaxID=1071382 RepID=H2ATE4_KAZAF|nr:hypothetical protein KAFR_0C06480 [Kazachstania africana CBS 2517]CCF57644.1 hypothetical protein KAFR_0C06480 [Kazachstania africana CBS 2517]
MLFQKSLLTTAASALFAAKAVIADDLPTIEIVNNKFFYSTNGSQFYIKGIAYQASTVNSTSGSTINDPLADYTTCSRDIPYLQALDTNVIRVYALNTSLDHTECMEALNDAGIYVIADLSSPSESINRDDPTWTLELFQRYKDVVDVMANYTNVLGFFAGNEVSNDYETADASAFVKAAIRDTKQYISDQGYRSIPVGYSSNDDSKTRVAMADYFDCGDSSDRADFYGINMYEWCGNSTYSSSGYEARTKEFANLTIPVFFSEYGCNAVTPRLFTEVQALYGENMTDVWSGGIVYMYFEETNNYGLVSISDDEVKTLDDYNNYSKQIHSIFPTSASTASMTSSSATLACPATSKYWEVATNLPPTPDEDLCECMNAASSCVVSSDVDSDDYSDLFSYVCAEVSCDGISANGTTGEYGAYSFCSSEQQLNFVLNLYYEAEGADSSACDWDGSATLQTATTQAGCSAALKEIGSIGTKSASDSAVYTGASGSGSTTATKKTGSSSKSSSTSSSSASSTESSSAGSINAKVNLGQVLLTSFATLSVLAGVSFALC